MFIEVYSIPVANWNKPSVTSVDPDNRRLIQIGMIKSVTISNKCEGRAELELSDGGKITVVGSYDQIIDRIKSVTEIANI